MRDHLGNAMVSSNLGFARGVLLLEDCEGTCNWVVSGTGGDDVHAFAAAAAFGGVNGLRIKTRTTGAAEGDGLMLSRRVSWPESGLLVVRWRYAMVNVSAFNYVYFTVMLANGGQGYEFTIQHRGGNDKVYYLAGSGFFVELADLSFVAGDGQWSTGEMVLDLQVMEWLEVMVNGVRADLAGEGSRAQGASAGRYVELEVGVVTAGAAPCDLYLDDLSVTEFRDV